MRVLKWDVPVDDQFHPIGDGPAVLVDTQDGHVTVVNVWTVETGVVRYARVYGTGQPIPDDLEHVGSTVAGAFVWHVFGRADS